MQTLKMNNGVEIPVLGFGVFQIPPAETEQAVVNAIAAGYRHIDTAQAYLNENEVGKGIARSGIARQELFVTTKVWVENAGETAATASLERSLQRLNLDYIDSPALRRCLRQLACAGKSAGGGQSSRYWRQQFHPRSRRGFGGVQSGHAAGKPD